MTEILKNFLRGGTPPTLEEEMKLFLEAVAGSERALEELFERVAAPVAAGAAAEAAEDEASFQEALAAALVGAWEALRRAVAARRAYRAAFLAEAGGRAGIRRWAAEARGVVRIPRRLWGHLPAIYIAEEAMRQVGVTPTPEAVGRLLGLSTEDVEALRGLVGSASLEDLREGGVEVAGAGTPEESLEAREERAMAEAVLREAEAILGVSPEELPAALERLECGEDIEGVTLDILVSRLRAKFQGRAA